MTVVRTAVWTSSILFRAEFFDEDGDPLSPTTVRIHIRQGKKSVYGDMDPESASFIYRLDTSVFKPGRIDWAIDASGDGDTKVAEDGAITLTANEARAAAA